MTFAAFDTLEFVETLKESGLPEKQAKAISSAVRKAHETADLATKADLEKLETGLRHEMGDLRKEMKELFLRQIIWLGSIVFLVVNTGPILPKLLHLG